MKNPRITPEQQTRLKKDIDDHPHKLIRKRCLILYLKSTKRPHGKIAEVVNCCAKTVTNVLKLYERAGIEGLYTLIPVSLT